MSFLLDTNVVSEAVKPRPHPGVVAWLDDLDEDRAFISVISLAEIRYGIDRLPEGRRRERLDVWLAEELPRRFEGRILAIDAAVADAWGRIVARRKGMGRPIEPMDAFIAATAEAHHLTLVTHNPSDFGAVVNAIFNPWE